MLRAVRKFLLRKFTGRYLTVAALLVFVGSCFLAWTIAGLLLALLSIAMLLWSGALDRREEALSQQVHQQLAEVTDTYRDGSEMVKVGTHHFQFGGMNGDGYCYPHQTFDCLRDLTPEESRALNEARPHSDPGIGWD